MVLRLEDCWVNGNDFAVDVVLIVVGDAVRLGDNRHGNIQLFNLCSELFGVLLDAFCKEQGSINIIAANSAFGKLFKYVVALSVAAEEAFSVGTLLILGKNDFTGTDIHGAKDGVITDLSLFIFHSRYLRECR